MGPPLLPASFAHDTMTPLETSFWGKKREEQSMLKAFLNYGLVAAVIVWAGVVALMAYRLDDSPWRWAFAALAVGGIATVAVIFKIRRYVDGLAKRSDHD
jgi:hypothetical protein